MSVAKGALKSLLRDLTKPAWLPSDAWMQLKRREGIVPDDEIQGISAAIDNATEAKASKLLSDVVELLRIGLIA